MLYMHYRPNLQATIDPEESFNIHVWMISKLVKAHPAFFALYIIASCYEKIYTRMTYRTSQALFKDLDKIRAMSISTSHRDNPFVATEQKSDEDFLALLRDSGYGSELLEHVHTHKLQGKDFYNQKSCTMFHQLLCKLLRAFLEALQGLKDVQSQKASSADLLARLESIVDIGSLLRLMIRGAAIKMHFQNIDSRFSNMPLTEPEIEQEEEAEEEAEFVERHATDVPKWKTSIELLKMVMIHFDAIQVLAHFARDHGILPPDGRVNIKVLHQPPPGNNEQMLIWRDLLRDKRYFPIPILTPSADELINFLDPDPPGSQPSQAKGKKEGKVTPASVNPDHPGSRPSQAKKKGKVTPDSVIHQLILLGRIGTTNKDEFPCAIDRIIGDLKVMTNCTSSGSLLVTDIIIQDLRTLKDTSLILSTDRVLRQISCIRQQVRTLQDNARLYTMLRNGTSLSTGFGAKGVTHCEALILWYLITMQSRDGRNFSVSCLFPFARVFLM